MKLTDTRIRATRAMDKDQWINDGAGLYLRIYPTGSRIWVVRRKQQGKTQIIRMGAYPGISLKQARLEAAHSTN